MFYTEEDIELTKHAAKAMGLVYWGYTKSEGVLVAGHKGPTPLALHKSFCPTLCPSGWSYTGFDEGFYLFQSGDYAKGFKEMRLLQEDLTKENIALMVKHGVTR